MKRILFLLFAVVGSCSAEKRSDIGQGSSPDKEVICFIYHRFGDSRYPTTNTPTKDFEAHLDYLVKNNFQILSFSDAIDYLQSQTPARKTAVITIDDGYKSFFKNGLPLLKKYGLPATLFINTKTVGGGDYMSWDDLREAAKDNMEIGNHTHSHAYFLNEPASTRYKTFREEILESQSIISKNMQLEPTVFSYPYGEFDGEMKKIAKSVGFIAAAAQNSGVMYNGADLYQCPRFPMSEAYSPREKFIEKASLHALRIEQESPADVTLTNDKQPLLKLTFATADLILKQLQCFVQGGACEVNIAETTPEKTTVTIRSVKPISGRRRTLYTLTIPDKKGKWHWFSHLWINNNVD